MHTLYTAYIYIYYCVYIYMYVYASATQDTDEEGCVDAINMRQQGLTGELPAEIGELAWLLSGPVVPFTFSFAWFMGSLIKLT